MMITATQRRTAKMLLANLEHHQRVQLLTCQQYYLFKNNKKIDHFEDKKPLIEENKTMLDRIMHFFSYTFRYGIISPWQKRIKALFGLGPTKPEDPETWYSRFTKGFDFSKQDEKKPWFSKFNVIRNTKDRIVRKMILGFGGLFFLYIFAKAIPGSFRSRSLRK